MNAMDATNRATMAVQSARVPAKMLLCTRDRRNQSKAQKHAPCQGGSAQNAKSSGRARELVSLVGALETLIVHLHAFHTRAARLSIPTRYSAGS